MILCDSEDVSVGALVYSIVKVCGKGSLTSLNLATFTIQSFTPLLSLSLSLSLSPSLPLSLLLTLMNLSGIFLSVASVASISVWE